MKTGLCHCIAGKVPGTSTRCGHVHAKPMAAKEWAKGILAIEALAGDSKVVWLAGLPKAARQARKILQTEVR